MIRYPCDYIDKGGARRHRQRARLLGHADLAARRARRARSRARARRARRRRSALTRRLRCKRARSTDADPRRVAASHGLEDPGVRRRRHLPRRRARDEATLAALAHEEQNRPLDPLADFPVTLTLARTATTPVASSSASITRSPTAARSSARSASSPRSSKRAHAAAPSPRVVPASIGRDESRRSALSPARARSRGGLAGYVDARAPVFARCYSARRSRRSYKTQQRLHAARTARCTGSSTTACWRPWNAARKRIGASLNSILTAAFFAANQRWHRARGAAIGRTTGTIAMETRPRDGEFASFANHLDVARRDAAARSHRRSPQRWRARCKRKSTPAPRAICHSSGSSPSARIVAGMPLAQMRRIDLRRQAHQLQPRLLEPDRARFPDARPRRRRRLARRRGADHRRRFRRATASGSPASVTTAG